MMPENIEVAIQRGYTFRFGPYITNAFQRISKDFWLFVGYTVLMILAVLIAGQVSKVFGLIFEAFGGFWGASFSTLAGEIATEGVTMAFVAGFAAACWKSDQEEIAEFNDTFSGFYHFGNMFKTGALAVILKFLFTLPGSYMVYTIIGTDYSNLLLSSTESVNREYNPVVLFAGILLIYGPLLYLTISWIYVPFLVYFYQMSGIKALETSRKLVAKNFGIFLLFVVVIGLLSLSGIFVLIIGVLASVPLGYLALYESFADAVKLNAAEVEQDDIIDHLTIN